MVTKSDIGFFICGRADLYNQSAGSQSSRHQRLNKGCSLILHMFSGMVAWLVGSCCLQYGGSFTHDMFLQDLLRVYSNSLSESCRWFLQKQLPVTCISFCLGVACIGRSDEWTRTSKEWFSRLSHVQSSQICNYIVCQVEINIKRELYALFLTWETRELKALLQKARNISSCSK